MTAGFAPLLKSNGEACVLIVEAIRNAGYEPGSEFAIAPDPVASSCYESGKHKLVRSGLRDKSSDEMTALYQDWIGQYPIISVEDGLAQNDWDGFRAHTAHRGDGIQIVGDVRFNPPL